MVHGGGHHRSGGGGGGGGGDGGSSRPVRHNHGSGHHNRNQGNRRSADNNRTSSNISWWAAVNSTHHHHHQHQQHQPPVVVYPYHTTGGADGHVSRQRQERHGGNDDCDYCGTCCCNLCCQALCLGMLCRACCSSSSSSNRHDQQVFSSSRNASASSNNGNNEPIRRQGGCCHGLGTFLSIFLLLILIASSGMKNDWTMNAGETRRVQPSFFTKSVTITTATGSSNSGSSSSVNVYDLTSCPALTGPVVTIQDSHTLTLGAGDYQYDYFYLNAGSTIQLKVMQQQQKTGSSYSSSSTEVFFFQGQDKLNDLENGNADNQDADDFARNALVQRYISGAGATASLMYRVKTTDVYILVYDNVSLYSSNMQSVIAVDYQVSLTSFDLSNQTPTCQEEETAGGPSLQECVVDYSMSGSGNRGCIIVQATGGGGSVFQEAIVHVQVTGHRQWILLLFCASIPFFIGMFMTHYYRRSHNINTGEGYEPVFAAAEDVNPPPTAPHYTTTDYYNNNESNTPPTAPPPQPSAPPAPFFDGESYSSGGDPLFNTPPPMAPTTAAVAAAAAATPLFAEAHILVDQQDFSSIPIVTAENVVAIPAEK